MDKLRELLKLSWSHHRKKKCHVTRLSLMRAKDKWEAKTSTHARL